MPPATLRAADPVVQMAVAQARIAWSAHLADLSVRFDHKAEQIAVHARKGAGHWN
jgi:hypothetical protein